MFKWALGHTGDWSEIRRSPVEVGIVQPIIYSVCWTCQAVVSDFWTINSSAVVSYGVNTVPFYTHFKIHCAIGIPQKTDWVIPRNFSLTRSSHPNQLKTSYPTQPAKGAGFAKASYLKVYLLHLIR